jgi:hypothetical protein
MDLEINMAFLSPTVLYPLIAARNTASTTSERPRNSSASISTVNSTDVAFGVWASIILIALALISAALGVAPLADPLI